MAGLGRRTFAAGEVLTAGNVMGYLQDQAVMNFAGTAARGSAIGTAVSEGMVSYLADTDSVEVYDGSAWKLLNGTIVQAVFASTSTSVSNTTTSPVSSGLTVSITPKYATSKIIVIANLNGVEKQGDAATAITANLYKNGSNVQEFADYAGYGMAAITNFGGISTQYVSTAGSTSAQTYTVYFNKATGTGGILVNNNNTVSSITALEVTA